jgi:hypothetical protein
MDATKVIGVCCVVFGFLSTMLKGVIVVNNYGKPRMIKFYEYYVNTLLS